MSCWVLVVFMWSPRAGQRNEAETGRLPGVDTAIFRVPSGTAPGNRHAVSGNPVLVGNLGFNWSAATSGTSGMDLDFSSQHLRPGYSDHRGHGFPLRCLSE